MEPDLLSDAARRDPYPLYTRLRASPAIHHDRRRNWWIASRYDDVTRVLKNDQEFSAVGAASFESTLLGADPPQHTNVRRRLERGLALREPSSWGSTLRTQARRLIGTVVEKRSFDLVADVAVPFPLLFILDLLGLEARLLDQVRCWSHSMVMESSGVPAKSSASAADVLKAEFTTFVDAHLRSVARGSPDVAWLKTLCGDLGLESTSAIVKLLLIAGTETTTNLIGNTVWLLLSRPELHRRCRDGVELLAPVIEESLRFESPVQWTRRIARRGVRMGEVDLPTGAQVIALIGSANRDERKFDRPDQFDVSRGGGAHVAFGSGAHYCFGANLARLETRILLEELLSSAPLLSLTRDEEPPWESAPQIRGLRRLWLETRPSSGG
jgi:cytochrome P450